MLPSAYTIILASSGGTFFCCRRIMPFRSRPLTSSFPFCILLLARFSATLPSDEKEFVCEKLDLPTPVLQHFGGWPGPRARSRHALPRRLQAGGFFQIHHRHRLDLGYGHALQYAH